jgi:hypothetical protein
MSYPHFHLTLTQVNEMVDLALLQSVSYIAGALGVCVAAVYYVLNLRITQRNQELSLKSQQQTLETRQTQLFMQIYMRYLEPDLFSDNLGKLFKRSWKDIEDYDKKYDGNPDGANLDVVMTYWEGVAVLINRGMIDIGLVYELMPTNVTATWGRFGPLIKEMRTRGAPPKLYILVEELSNKLAEYARLRGDQVVTDYSAPTLRPSEDSTV